MIAVAIGEAIPALVIALGALYALRFDRKTTRPPWDWRRLL